jgi:hypothetical protein
VDSGFPEPFGTTFSFILLATNYFWNGGCPEGKLSLAAAHLLSLSANTTTENS